MQVSVETLSGLERKVTISLPADQVEEEVTLRLKDIARKAKVDGFRPGKAPFNLVQKRYDAGVRDDVTRELARKSLHQVFTEKDIFPAGYPTLHPDTLEPGKDFTFSATFEVFPEIQVQELDKDKVEVVTAELKDKDVDAMLEKLREQSKTWKSVSRAVKKGDKLTLDFKGFVGDEAFAGGEAKGFQLEIGSKSMIPGFEDALIGKKAGKAFDIEVTFPEDYGHETLAGKNARFEITLHEINEPVLPVLDDAFAAQFNITEGGVEALKADIKQNMTRELERRLSNMNRDNVFEALRQKNTFDIPKALVDREIQNLMHEMYHRIFGPEHHENEKMPNFPREMFQDEAQKRVHMGLLFSEYVKKHDLKADQARIDAMLEKLSSAYETPEELKAYYKKNTDKLAEIEALVLEEMAAEKILTGAKEIKKKMDYNEVMNPSKAQQGE